MGLNPTWGRYFTTQVYINKTSFCSHFLSLHKSWGQGVHKNIGFLAILVQIPCKTTKLPSLHSMLGHHWPAFSGILPSSTKLKKKCSQSWTPLKNFLDYITFCCIGVSSKFPKDSYLKIFSNTTKYLQFQVSMVNCL